MCEQCNLYPPMNRWFLWVGAALILHVGLLLIPVTDQPLTPGVPVAEISVHLSEHKREGADGSHQPEQLLAPANKPPLKAATSTHAEITEVRPQLRRDQSVLQQATAPAESKAQSSARAPVKASVQTTEQTTEQSTHEKAQVERAGGDLQAAESEARPVTAAVSTINVTSTTVKSEQNRKIVAVAGNNASRVARAVSQHKPKYPRRAIVRNQEGSVRVELVIRTDGRVEQAVLLESSGYPLLDRSVMNFVENERFYATLENGVPVLSKQLYTYHFVLR